MTRNRAVPSLRALKSDNKEATIAFWALYTVLSEISRPAVLSSTIRHKVNANGGAGDFEGLTDGLEVGNEA